MPDHAIRRGPVADPDALWALFIAP